MKDTHLTIRFDLSLKEKVEMLARSEKRTIANQAAYLIEKGLLAFDTERLAGQLMGASTEEPGARGGKTA